MPIVAHWTTLTEIEKLTESELLAGVIQETYEEGQLLKVIPATGISGKSLKWNREKTLPGGDFYDIGDSLDLKSDVDYDSVEFTLKRIIRQDQIDEFVAKTYNNLNDYKAVLLKGLVRGVARTAETKLLYGDASGKPKEFDGLHQLVTAGQAIDGGQTALSLKDLRDLVDLVRPRPDILLMNKALANRIDFAAQFGVTSADVNTIHQTGMTSFGQNEFGSRVTLFDGIPIVRSDYMTKEEENTGVIGTAPRVSDTTKAQYSILALRFGAIDEGGVSLLVGADTATTPDFFKIREFEALEDYDAGGIRLRAYMAIANGSTKSVAGLYDVTDAAVTM